MKFLQWEPSCSIQKGGRTDRHDEKFNIRKQCSWYNDYTRKWKTKIHISILGKARDFSWTT